jgi:FkbM family methyltransferase
MCELGEPWMIDLLSGLFPLRAGLFLDVGVNLGQTMLCVRALDPARPYAGVEPNPLCVAYVESLKSANGLADCLVAPVGIAETAAIRQLVLYHGDTTDSSASLVENFRPDEAVTHVVLVPVFPYEEVARAAKLDDPAIVKIDVEGAESEILCSMRGLLGRARPWLIVEILPCYTSSNRARIERQERILSLMRESGYSMFRLIKSEDSRLSRLDAVDDIGVHGDMDWVDYLFCPHVDVPRIASWLPISDVRSQS